MGYLNLFVIIKFVNDSRGCRPKAGVYDLLAPVISKVLPHVIVAYCIGQLCRTYPTIYFSRICRLRYFGVI